MEYIFRTTAYDVAALTPEVGKALEKRAERYSRQRLPGMWKATDKLSQRSGTQQMTPGRLRYRRFVGVVLIVLGLFMMIPGLMKPQELLLPLFAGFCALVFGIESLWSTRKKRTNRFEKAARKFLSDVSKAETVEVLFSEEGMVIGDRPLIPYSDMKDFIETQAGYLITWADQAAFLQKKDFLGESSAEFANFVRNEI